MDNHCQIRTRICVSLPCIQLLVDGILNHIPYTVQPLELTAGIPKREYARRRKALMDSLPEGSIVVCVSAPVKYMSGSTSN